MAPSRVRAEGSLEIAHQKKTSASPLRASHASSCSTCPKPWGIYGMQKEWESLATVGLRGITPFIELDHMGTKTTGNKIDPRQGDRK